jgi:starch phosphorylase
MIDRTARSRRCFRITIRGNCRSRRCAAGDGEWLRLRIDLPGYAVWLRAWRVQIGRPSCMLLDSNDAANFPAWRGITSELYGGGPELRLQQELLLGIGGWRLLAALGMTPQVCHLNEGHAAFAVLERASSLMQQTGQSFELALAASRAGNLFTTHTAVAAGFDRFAPELIEQVPGPYAQRRLGISVDELLALGRRDAQDASESFNMAYLAIRGSGAVNGVSRLHGEVSRQIFGGSFRAGRRMRCRSATSPTACTRRPGIPRRPSDAAVDRTPAARTAGVTPDESPTRRASASSAMRSCGATAMPAARR